MVAQLQQIHLQQQLQQPLHPEYYNISANQSHSQRRREISRDSSRWSLTEGEVVDIGTKEADDDCSYANESVILQHLQKKNTPSVDLVELQLATEERADSYSQRLSRHSTAYDDFWSNKCEYIQGQEVSVIKFKIKKL